MIAADPGGEDAAVPAPAARPLRLLQVIASLDPSHGGPIDGARRLTDIWRVSGHEVDFVTLDSPDAPYLADTGTTHAFGAFGGPADHDTHGSFQRRFGYSPAYRDWLKRNYTRYDAVIVHALWNYSTLAARQVLVNGGVPYFIFPHGCLDPWFKQASPLKTVAKSVIWPFSEGRLMNKASAVLFTTEEERQLADRVHWPYDIRSEIVGFGSSDAPDGAERQEAAFRAAVPALGDRPYLLFLSRLHEKKGCDLLIEAFARIAADHPTLDLVMAGPDQTGWRAELEALAEARGVTPRIHWTGMIRDEVKWGAYRGCEAFALTSHTENFGIVVAEALACSKPVLISNKVNLWREVAACEAGLVENDTLEGSVRLLTRFLALTPDARAQMGARARACFDAHFRMETAAAAVIDVIRRYKEKP